MPHFAIEARGRRFWVYGCRASEAIAIAASTALSGLADGDLDYLQDHGQLPPSDPSKTAGAIRQLDIMLLKIAPAASGYCVIRGRR